MILLVDFHVHFWLLLSKRAHLKGSSAKKSTSSENFGGADAPSTHQTPLPPPPLIPLAPEGLYLCYFPRINKDFIHPWFVFSLFIAFFTLLILRNFVSLRTLTVYMENSLRYEISLRSNWTKWNLHRSEFHFAWGHVNGDKEVTLYRSEVLPRGEIFNRFEFTSGLM